RGGPGCLHRAEERAGHVVRHAANVHSRDGEALHFAPAPRSVDPGDRRRDGAELWGGSMNGVAGQLALGGIAENGEANDLVDVLADGPSVPQWNAAAG